MSSRTFPSIISVSRILSLAAILFSLAPVDCGHHHSSHRHRSETEDNPVKESVSACDLVYQEYLGVLQNFTNCELQFARPFRLCLGCAEQYEAAKAIYTNLTEDSRHAECKNKYFQSDKVQIIPTLQSNMQNLWNKARCENCYTSQPVRWDTGRIKYAEQVTIFLQLYENFTDCINSSLQVYSISSWAPVDNTSKCQLCNASYVALNSQYNKIYVKESGDVCMDVADRMNYTRLLWNFEMKCAHYDGSHDSLPVIVISCVVACTPILFYVSVRLTGKVGQKKIFQQKRLGKGQKNQKHLQESLYGSCGDNGSNRRRYTTTD